MGKDLKTDDLTFLIKKVEKEQIKLSQLN